MVDIVHSEARHAVRCASCMPPIQPPVVKSSIGSFPAWITSPTTPGRVALRKMHVDIAIGVGHRHQAVFDGLGAEGGFAGGVERLRGLSFLGTRRENLLFPIVDDFLRHPKLGVHVRNQLRPGLRHRVVTARRFQVPMRVEHLRDAAGELEDILGVRGIAAIDEKTSAVALRAGDNVAFPAPEISVIVSVSFDAAGPAWPKATRGKLSAVAPAAKARRNSRRCGFITVNIVAPQRPDRCGSLHPTPTRTVILCTSTWRFL